MWDGGVLKWQLANLAKGPQESWSCVVILSSCGMKNIDDAEGSSKQQPTPQISNPRQAQSLIVLYLVVNGWLYQFYQLCHPRTYGEQGMVQKYVVHKDRTWVTQSQTSRYSSCLIVLSYKLVKGSVFLKPCLFCRTNSLM